MRMLAKYVRFKQHVIHIDAIEAVHSGNYSRVQLLFAERELLMEKVNRVINERAKAAANAAAAAASAAGAETISGSQPHQPSSIVDASSQKKRKSMLAESE